MTQRFKIRERRSKALFWIRAERGEPEIKKCYSGIGRYIVLAEMEKIRADLIAKHSAFQEIIFDESKHFRICDYPERYILRIHPQKGEKTVCRYYKNVDKETLLTEMKEIRQKLLYKHFKDFM